MIEKVATAVTDALRGQPMTLALVIFNLIFVVIVYWGVRDQRQQQAALMQTMLANSRAQVEMLARCDDAKGVRP